MHWVYPYSRLRAANVHSTVQCLHLAATGARLKSLHFVSSTSVLDTPYYMQCAPPPRCRSRVHCSLWTSHAPMCECQKLHIQIQMGAGDLVGVHPDLARKI